jgi:hypothetical protein
VLHNFLATVTEIVEAEARHRHCCHLLERILGVTLIKVVLRVSEVALDSYLREERGTLRAGLDSGAVLLVECENLLAVGLEAALVTD